MKRHILNKDRIARLDGSAFGKTGAHVLFRRNRPPIESLYAAYNVDVAPAQGSAVDHALNVNIPGGLHLKPCLYTAVYFYRSHKINIARANAHIILNGELRIDIDFTAVVHNLPVYRRDQKVVILDLRIFPNRQRLRFSCFWLDLIAKDSPSRRSRRMGDTLRQNLPLFRNHEKVQIFIVHFIILHLSRFAFFLKAEIPFNFSIAAVLLRLTARRNKIALPLKPLPNGLFINPIDDLFLLQSAHNRFKSGRNGTGTIVETYLDLHMVLTDLNRVLHFRWL